MIGEAKNMFVGAYWSSRDETRERATARIVTCIRELGTISELLSTWYKKGGTKSSALRTPLAIDLPRVDSELVANRRDSDGSSITDLGFRFSAWNGSNVSVSVTIGACNKYVRNAVVVDVDDEAGLSRADYRRMLIEVVKAFDPDFAVVTSDEVLAEAKAGNPWEAGWFTYDRSGGLSEH